MRNVGDIGMLIEQSSEVTTQSKESRQAIREGSHFHMRFGHHAGEVHAVRPEHCIKVVLRLHARQQLLEVPLHDINLVSRAISVSLSLKTKSLSRTCRYK